jgi:hypothetical protein
MQIKKWSKDIKISYLIRIKISNWNDAEGVEDAHLAFDQVKDDWKTTGMKNHFYLHAIS